MKTLLISGGPSASKAKDLLKKNKYDLVVGVNHAGLTYPVDYLVMLEAKPISLINLIVKAHRKGNFKARLIIVERCAKRINRITRGIPHSIVTLGNYTAGTDEPDIRSLEAGIINTYLTRSKSVGTSCGALHFCCSRGATHIDLVGMEYSWSAKGPKHHSPEAEYAYIETKLEDNRIVKLPNGKRSRVLYVRTAENVGALINNHLTPAGITVEDHSGGILQEFIKKYGEEVLANG